MKNNIIENWKAVPGYENYEVSDLGNVRSLNYNKTGKIKIIKPVLNRGYYRVMLYKNGEKRKKFLVQRLIYSTFNGPIPPDMTVDHINEIRTDNRLENLQLLSRGDNTRKACKGKKLSEETKAKIGNTMKGQIPWNKGKKHSAKTKAKMSASHRARRELAI